MPRCAGTTNCCAFLAACLARCSFGYSCSSGVPFVAVTLVQPRRLQSISHRTRRCKITSKQQDLKVRRHPDVGSAKRRKLSKDKRALLVYTALIALPVRTHSCHFPRQQTHRQLPIPHTHLTYGRNQRGLSLCVTHGSNSVARLTTPTLLPSIAHA